MKNKIIILLLLFLVTGCWNYRELNNCAIVTGMAIDYEDNNYIVTLLFSNSSKSQSNINLLSNNGKTIYEAVKKIGLSTPKEIYLSHLSCIIVSDKIAKQGITPVLDYLLREPESNQNFNLIIAKDYTAKEILSTVTPLSDYPSQNINSTIKVSEKEQARIIDSNFNNFVSTLLKPGINSIANSITLIDNKKNTKIDNLAVFKKDKLVDWASTDESIGINMLKNNIKNLYTSIEYDNSKIVVTCTKYKIETKLDKNKIVMEIYGEGRINEVENSLDFSKDNILEKIEKKVSENLSNYAEKALKKYQKEKNDIFGFGNKLYKNNTKEFNKISNWDNYFSTLDYELNVNFKITNLGSLKESIGELSQ